MTEDKQIIGSRRHFLATNAMGIGGIALASLIQSEGFAVKPDLDKKPNNTLPKKTHHQPKARGMISFFMQGGPSQVDLCDPKPLLKKWAGKDFPEKIKYDNAAQASRKVMPSPWKFKKHGESGMDFSELLPGFGEIADDICLIRSMRTGVNNHGQSIHALNSGRTVKGRPALGSWITYGLGSENQNLPAFMVLRDPANLPVEGVLNWSSGWLPGIYQGTVSRAKEPRIQNLEPPEHLKGKPQENFLHFLKELNRGHSHHEEAELEARIASFELAARMQTAASEVMDLSGETDATKKLYGIHEKETEEFGSRCLIARRLIERGVRFVQLFTKNQYWDHHGGIIKSLPLSCKKIDRPIAGLIHDMKSRGLLESNIVHWGGEMGRLPVIQNEKNPGRDHNTYGFSTWLAGGGIKAGHIHGSTDEWGHRAEENVVNHYDYHATLLHLLGLDHTLLTYKRASTEHSLTDGQGARIVEEILA